MQFKRFLEFGKELTRRFLVHEDCYDCAEFYHGCTGWRASRERACDGFGRLPNVMPGTCGQVFPASRRRPTMDSVLAVEGRLPVGVNPYAGITTHRARVRTCGCGAPLPKGKRFCDLCRIQNRRQTKRDYMRTYMEQRRSTAVGSDSHMPFPAAATQSTQGSGGDLVLAGLPVRGACPNRTSVLTKDSLAGGQT